MGAGGRPQRFAARPDDIGIGRTQEGKKMSKLTWAGALALGFGISGSASGAVVTVLSDPFTDGSRAHGTDALDGSWFANSSATGNAPAVTTDALLPDRGATNTNALGWQP